MKKIEVIDSHTGGEPTRIIVAGGPDLGSGSMSERLEKFQANFDEIRSAVVNEPRGSDVLVGGLICKPIESGSTAGVIFFNNAGFLGMCGHGMIGLMVSLKHLGCISDGVHQIETPVGMVTAKLKGNTASIKNVPSYRLSSNVEVNVPDYGTVVGDIAWGGNWFFLVKDSTENLVVKNADHLTRVCLQIRDALDEQGITGNGEWIDHVELFGDPEDSENDSRNFVLCPGGAYDRSPCGTGTSAKVACLAADGKLKPGQVWKQESILGSVFETSFEVLDGKVIVTISGSAYVCGESSLLLNPDDPFQMGIRQ